jgi:hypothetical protein
MWQKVIITASAVPIAIFCNVMRVSGQGLLDSYVSHKWSEGFAHAFAGMVMLVPGFFLILLVGWVLDRLFIEEADDEAVAAAVEMKAPAAEQSLVVEIPRRKAGAGLAAAPQAEKSEAKAAAGQQQPLVIEIPRRARGNASPRDAAKQDGAGDAPKGGA